MNLTDLQELKSLERMRILYERSKDKTVSNDNYEAKVCGYHYKWDDKDRESIIVRITEVKTPSFRGINYMIQGDVIKEHGNLGYEFINIFDAEKLGLFNDSTA